MPRLPKVGGDTGSWGEVLNDFLSQSHDDSGNLKTDTVGAPQLKPNSVTSAAIADGAISNAKIADGAVGTHQLADDSVTVGKLQGASQADGIATLDGDGKLPEAQLPDRLGQDELSATSAKVAATRIDNPALRQVPDSLLSWRRSHQGVIAPYVAGDWKSTQSGVGTDVVWDHQRMKYVLVHSGDDHTGSFGSSTGTSQIGIVITDDIDDWNGKHLATPDPILGPNPTAGQPDSGGLTYPKLFWDDTLNLWVMFYIAFPSPGFEEGTYSSICAATCQTISTNPSDWTRRGAMITSADVPWIAAGLPNAYVYRPGVIRMDDGTWGCFFNGGKYGQEKIGFARAQSSLGPWTAEATALPLPPGAAHIADPDVIKIGNVWYMVASAADGGNHQRIATSSGADFPLTWNWRTEKYWGSSDTTSGDLMIMRTSIIQTPKGLRMFGFDRLTGPYGKWGPVMLKPNTQPQPRMSDEWNWMMPTVARVGTWKQTLGAGLPLGGCFYSTTNAQNDSITFEADFRHAQPWYISMIHVKNNNRGIYSFYLDDSTTPLGTIDGYAASETIARDYLTITDKPSEGRHRITVKITSKNASSSGYNGTIVQIVTSL